VIDEREVQEMLRRRAASVPTLEVGAPRAVRRARRRLLVNGIVTTVAAVAIVAATFAGIHAIRSGPVPVDNPSERFGIFAPVAGRIAYVNGNDRGYARSIWAVDPNGPADTTEGPTVADDVASTLVPFGPEDAEPVAWSSDGTELLLRRSVGDPLLPSTNLSILHADGSETAVNAEPLGIVSADLSPDGARVVFAGEYDLSGLYVIDAEGGEPVHLPIPQAVDGANTPTFSPDGTKIAFLAGGGRRVEAEVWVANADGTGAHEILADEPTAIGGEELTWSPAGDRLAIAFDDDEGSDGPAIYTFAPDGSDFTKVITGGGSPYWSPDGSQIAYTVQCEAQPTASCPEGSILRSQFDAHPTRFGGGAAGLAIADADGSHVREFGFAASGPWHPGER
jgi:Tol biopolymer transport system component